MEITRQQKNNITPLSEIIDKRVGRPGTEKRETFDKEVENLVIASGLRSHYREPDEDGAVPEGV